MSHAGCHDDTFYRSPTSTFYIPRSWERVDKNYRHNSYLLDLFLRCYLHRSTQYNHFSSVPVCHGRSKCTSVYRLRSDTPSKERHCKEAGDSYTFRARIGGLGSNLHDCRRYRGKNWSDGTASEYRYFEFEWRFYALSASKVIFRARTYSRITSSVRSWWLLDEWN